MASFDKAVLRQEVEELTALLRLNKEWSDLRRALQSKGLAADRTFLAGFIEDEQGNEFGVIITDELQIFEYQRDTLNDSSDFEKWRRVANASELLSSFPATAVALELAGEARSR